MGKNLGINQRMGLCGQENDTGSRENKSQHHYELHEYTFHGKFRWNKINNCKIDHQSVSQWKILLRQTIRNFW